MRKAFVIEFAKPSLIEKEGKAEVWAELCRAGEYKGYHGGETSLTEEDFETMIRNFNDPTVSNSPPIHIGHPIGEAPAVGWIRELKREGKKLLGLLEFIPSFVAQAKEGAWKYLSIEADRLLHPETGEDVGLTLVGLGVVNRPFIRGLAPLSLSDESNRSVSEINTYLESAIKETINMADNANQEEVKEEKKEEEAKADEVKAADEPCSVDAWLREALELPELSQEALLEMLRAVDVAALKALLQPAKAEEKEAPEAEAMKAQEEAQGVAMSAQIESLKLLLADEKAKNEKLQSQVDAIEKMKLGAMVDAKIKAGEIHPSKRDAFVKLAMSDRKLFDEIAGKSELKSIQLSQLIPTAKAESKGDDISPEAKAYEKELSKKVTSRLGIKG